MTQSSFDLLDAVRLVDLVIAFSVAEGVALAAWHRTTGRGVAPRDFVANGVAGLSLMLALRAGVSGAGLVAVAGWLGAAGAAHATDIVSRWRRNATAVPRLDAAPAAHLGRSLR